MAVVLVTAFGLAAIKNATATWAGSMFVLTCGALALAVVGVVFRGRAERAWWLGFARLSSDGATLALAFWWRPTLPTLPTIAPLDAVCSSLSLSVEFGQPGATVHVPRLLRSATASGPGSPLVWAAGLPVHFCRSPPAPR